MFILAIPMPTGTRDGIRTPITIEAVAHPHFAVRNLNCIWLQPDKECLSFGCFHNSHHLLKRVESFHGNPLPSPRTKSKALAWPIMHYVLPVRGAWAIVIDSKKPVSSKS